MIDAAIVGLGWWGKNLVKAVQGKSPYIRFTRGVSKELQDAAPFCAEHAIALTDDVESILADRSVQAVVLATPHSLHADQIVAAALAGKHVFCEKPLALKAADARRAIDACTRCERVLAVGQNKRFWPSMVALRDVVASGELGRVMHVEGHYSNDHSTKHFSGWRDLQSEAPGAGLTGTGIHIIDAFVSLVGPARDVRASVSRFREGHDPRDTTSVTCSFANGVSGYFAMVRPTPIFWRVHVFGDAGSVEATGENDIVVRRALRQPEHLSLPPVDSIRAELDAFALAIPSETGTVVPYPISTEQMAHTIEFFEAVIHSLGQQPTQGLPCPLL